MRAGRTRLDVVVGQSDEAEEESPGAPHYRFEVVAQMLDTMRWVEVQSPLRDVDLLRIDARTRQVQLSSRLKDSEFRILGRRLAEYPSVALRVYGDYSGTITDLDFLRYFPTLARFVCDLYWLENIDGLAALREGLVDVNLKRTKRRISMTVLGELQGLRRVALEGHRKDVEVLSTLGGLEGLWLSRVKLPSLELLLPLKQLGAVALMSSATPDISQLASLRKLKDVHLWNMPTRSDVSVIGEIKGLRSLDLHALGRVTALPSFAGLRNLRSVAIRGLNSLTDFSPVAAAPRLRELRLAGKNLTSEQVACFRGHPTLKAASIYAGSLRRNEALLNYLGVQELPAYTRQL
jgi:hypothetical protein